MKFYLSSYKLGNEVKRLTGLMPKKNRKIGYIPNALDLTKANPERRKTHVKADVDSLKKIGLKVEVIDLKKYFKKQEKLRKKLDKLGGVWVSGGNVFVLRQAMKLSGFDRILKGLIARKDFLYGGYSAAGCVLSPSLKAYEIVDEATDTPYKGQKKIIWKGIGLIRYAFLPHFNSRHPESENISKEVEYCKKNKIRYKAIKDGEVIIFEKC